MEERSAGEMAKFDRESSGKFERGRLGSFETGSARHDMIRLRNRLHEYSTTKHDCYTIEREARILSNEDKKMLSNASNSWLIHTLGKTRLLPGERES